MQFVPGEWRDESVPCRFIPLTDRCETIDYFYRCGTQLELEEALASWLRSQIRRIEQERAHAAEPSTTASAAKRIDKKLILKAPGEKAN